MTHRASQKSLRLVGSFLLVLMLIMAFLPVMASAAETTVEPKTLVITGDFEEKKFELNSSRNSLFSLKDVVPGDSWTGKIEIQNDTKDVLEVSLLSIDNELLDKTLFEIMTLKIKNGNTVLYNGAYAAEAPVLGNISLVAGGKVTLDVTVGIPASAGNEIQNRRMSSKWVFEAKSYAEVADGTDSTIDKYPAQTGVDLVLDTVRDSSFLWIFALALIGAGTIGIMVYRNKKALMNERSVEYCEDENKK